MIPYKCKCGQVHAVTDDAARRRVICQFCGTVGVVPDAPALPDPSRWDEPGGRPASQEGAPPSRLALKPIKYKCRCGVVQELPGEFAMGQRGEVWVYCGAIATNRDPDPLSRWVRCDVVGTVLAGPRPKLPHADDTMVAIALVAALFLSAGLHVATGSLWRDSLGGYESIEGRSWIELRQGQQLVAWGIASLAWFAICSSVWVGFFGAYGWVWVFGLSLLVGLWSAPLVDPIRHLDLLGNEPGNPSLVVCQP